MCKFEELGACLGFDQPKHSTDHRPSLPLEATKATGIEREAIHVEPSEVARGHGARQTPEDVPGLEAAEAVRHSRGDEGLGEQGGHRHRPALGHAADDVIEQRGHARIHGHARAVLRDVLAHVLVVVVNTQSVVLRSY